jgi:hypothetical protein
VRLAMQTVLAFQGRTRSATSMATDTCVALSSHGVVSWAVCFVLLLLIVCL